MGAALAAHHEQSRFSHERRLADVSGGVDWNHAVDNGIRWGSAGAFTGAGIGVACGGGVLSAEGAGIGGALGGVGGLIGGTGYDLYQQRQAAKQPTTQR